VHGGTTWVREGLAILDEALEVADRYATA